MDGVDVLIVIVKVIVAFALWIVATALLIWGERRLVAKMQSRIGPNRLGPGGVLGRPGPEVRAAATGGAGQAWGPAVARVSDG